LSFDDLEWVAARSTASAFGVRSIAAPARRVGSEARALARRAGFRRRCAARRRAPTPHHPSTIADASSIVIEGRRPSCAAPSSPFLPPGHSVWPAPTPAKPRRRRPWCGNLARSRRYENARRGGHEWRRTPARVRSAAISETSRNRRSCARPFGRPVRRRFRGAPREASILRPLPSACGTQSLEPHAGRAPPNSPLPPRRDPRYTLTHPPPLPRGAHGLHP